MFDHVLTRVACNIPDKHLRLFLGKQSFASWDSLQKTEIVSRRKELNADELLPKIRRCHIRLSRTCFKHQILVSFQKFKHLLEECLRSPCVLFDQLLHLCGREEELVGIECLQFTCCCLQCSFGVLNSRKSHCGPRNQEFHQFLHLFMELQDLSSISCMLDLGDGREAISANESFIDSLEIAFFDSRKLMWILAFLSWFPKRMGYPFYTAGNSSSTAGLVVEPPSPLKNSSVRQLALWFIPNWMEKYPLVDCPITMEHHHF